MLMTTIETIFIIIVAMISLPYFCKAIRRPSLLYSAYLVIGLFLGDFLEHRTQFMMEEVGRIGFALLLFFVGLEIEIPPWRVVKRAFPFCFAWFGIQMTLFALCCWLCGWGWGYGCIAAAGINACSLGITYGLLKSQSAYLENDSGDRVLVEMVLLEIASLLILTASNTIYARGWSIAILWQMLGFATFLIVIRLFSGMIQKHMSRLVKNAGKWRIHQLLLIILFVAVIGERLGLSAAKTAFFLGLFMNAITDEGIKLEDELKPIAQGIFIPVFFIGLGAKVSLSSLFTFILPIAGAIVAALFFVRFWIFRKFHYPALNPKFFLLYCPNITLVAVVAEILMHNQAPKEHIDLLLAIGLIMTITATFLFPTPIQDKQEIPAH